MQSSRGLSLQWKLNTELTNSIEITLENAEPFNCTNIPIRVLADLPSKDHQVTIYYPWSTKPLQVPLSFTPPLTTSWKLYTVNHRKFIQVSVVGHCEKTLLVKLPTLSVGEGVEISDFNIPSSQVCI